MKRCFLMFFFLVLSLLLAVLTENSNEEFTDKMASNEVVLENQIINEMKPDNVFKDQ